MPSKAEPKLSMKYAGGVVKHLGLSMYHGAVPAIAEFIANAWDADSKTVRITIPFDESDFAAKEIVIEDKGEGMSYSDCDSKFLVVGRDRRKMEGEKSIGKRPLMAHKGLGKLAGFGIADIVEVETCKDCSITKFTMNYEAIETLQQGETYYPDPVEKWNDKKRENGTIIRLKALRLKKRIDKDEFKRSMGRKFSILDSGFKVFINKDLLERNKGPFEFYYPKDDKLVDNVTIDKNGRGECQVAGAGEVKWWIGFTEEPIKQPELRRISIMVRGKMANNPFDFEFSKGTTGQLGLEYITGEVEADFVDTLEYDGVSTGRTSLIWERPSTEALRDWGRELISKALEDWAEKRTQKRIEELQKPRKESGLPTFQQRVENYPTAERKEAERAIKALASIRTITPERFEENVTFLLGAMEDRTLQNMVREISTVEPEAQLAFYDLLREFDVLEAVRVSKLVDAHLMIIRKFRELIESKAKEKPDMQDHLKKYPWLIDVNMADVQHEKQLKTIVSTMMKGKLEREEKDTRVDFLWMADSGRAFVIEVKRPGIVAELAEVEQLEHYVDILQTEFQKITNPKDKRTVGGYIIASDFNVDQSKLDRLYRTGIMTRTWDTLLIASEASHKEYMKLEKNKAPKDDPRIKELFSKVA